PCRMAEMLLYIRFCIYGFGSHPEALSPFILSLSLLVNSLTSPAVGVSSDCVSSSCCVSESMGLVSPQRIFRAGPGLPGGLRSNTEKGMGGYSLADTSLTRSKINLKYRSPLCLLNSTVFMMHRATSPMHDGPNARPWGSSLRRPIMH